MLFKRSEAVILERELRLFLFLKERERAIRLLLFLCFVVTLCCVLHGACCFTRFTQGSVLKTQLILQLCRLHADCAVSAQLDSPGTYLYICIYTNMYMCMCMCIMYARVYVSACMYMRTL